MKKTKRWKAAVWCYKKHIDINNKKQNIETGRQ